MVFMLQCFKKLGLLLVVWLKILPVVVVVSGIWRLISCSSGVIISQWSLMLLDALLETSDEGFRDDNFLALPTAPIVLLLFLSPICEDQVIDELLLLSRCLENWHRHISVSFWIFRARKSSIFRKHPLCNLLLDVLWDAVL